MATSSRHATSRPTSAIHCTDRVDATRLAVLYAKDDLTPIHIPDAEDEQARSIIRSRWFVVQQRCDLKRHILSLARQLDFNYKQESGNKSYWTQAHLKWLKEIAAAASPVIAENFAMLLHQYAFLNDQVSVYDANSTD